jgi:hypothetical protein
MRDSRDRPHYEDKEESMGWRDMIYDFVERPVRNMTEPIFSFIEKQTDTFMKNLSALIILTLGGLFLLLGVAKSIGEFTGLGDWAGYLIVGVFLLLVGMITKRSNHV